MHSETGFHGTFDMQSQIFCIRKAETTDLSRLTGQAGGWFEPDEAELKEEVFEVVVPVNAA